MTHKKSIFSEVIARKIPQIIGMYIASLWLVMEISDWMSGRFDLSEQLSTYVFVGVLSLLPTVILLAWGHGKPGKDQWTSIEKVCIPINILLSGFALMYLFNPSTVNMSIHETKITINNGQEIETQKPLAIMEKMSAVDVKTGSAVSEETTNQANHQDVVSYFWDNNTDDESLDWLSYGASWLFSQDLERTPDISAITPYDSKLLLNELINKGFPKALNIPMALAIQVANKQSKEWIVMGSFAYDDIEKELLRFEAKLYNVKTGVVENTYSFVNQNKLTSLDEISNAIGDFLLKAKNESNIIPDYAIADHTSSNIEAIKALIKAKNMIAFENDYTEGLKLIEQAIELDGSFAEAMLLASKYYRAQGDFKNATKYSKQALNLDYKIYKESVYELKANLFAMTGEQNKALLVLENWAEMFPTSPLAHATLANKYLFGDNSLDKAEKQFEKLLSIDSSNQNTLINLGQIYRVQGDKQKTLSILKQYLASNPEKVAAYMELANAYKQFGMFDDAIEMYQQASILGSQNYAAEIGIASTIATQGDYIGGLSLLSELLLEENTDNQNLMVHNEKLLIFMQTGQISKAFEELELMKQPAKKILPPLRYILAMDGTSVQLLILQGQYEEALEYTQLIRENTKPPLNNIPIVFNIMTYLSMEDKENFKTELLAFEEFLETYPIPHYKQFISAWNATSTYWNGDIENALQQLDLAIEESKQSIISLQSSSFVEQFIFRKAELMFELGDNKGTQRELDFLLTRNPLYANAHYLNAKIHHQTGETEQRDESLKQAHHVWKYADKEYVDYKNLLEFETEIGELN
jgi:tetratricopeptide (TPR) repeat protein